MQFQEITVAVSDLHLGTAGCRFYDLYDILLELQKKENFILRRVVIVGDLIHAPIEKTPYRDDMLSALNLLSYLSGLGIEIVYVKGNHESRKDHWEISDALEAFPVIDVYWLENAGEVWAFTHGHDYVDLNVTAFEDFLSWFYNGVPKPLARLLRPIQSSIKRYFSSIPKYADSLKKNVCRSLPSASHIACGHVHSLEEAMVNETVYVNLGSWQDSKAGLLVINHGVPGYILITA